jgi:hypothetical protein
MTMTEEDVRKAWSMVRRAAERLAEEAARLETAATGDGLRDASLLAAQRSARDLLDVHLGAVGRHYDRVLRDRLTRRAEDDVGTERNAALRLICVAAHPSSSQLGSLGRCLARGDVAGLLALPRRLQAREPASPRACGGGDARHSERPARDVRSSP